MQPCYVRNTPERGVDQRGPPWDISRRDHCLQSPPEPRARRAFGIPGDDVRAQRILAIIILTVILGGLLLVYAGYRHCFTRGCT